jgi:hypothetical protein
MEWEHERTNEIWVGNIVWVQELRSLGNVRVGVQDKVAMGEHATGMVPHNRFGLNGEVVEHFIQVPAANKADDVGINASTQKGHGTSCMKTMGGDIFRQKNPRRKGPRR